MLADPTSPFLASYEVLLYFIDCCGARTEVEVWM